MTCPVHPNGCPPIDLDKPLRLERKIGAHEIVVELPPPNARVTLAEAQQMADALRQTAAMLERTITLQLGGQRRPGPAN